MAKAVNSFKNRKIILPTALYQRSLVSFPTKFLDGMKAFKIDDRFRVFKIGPFLWTSQTFISGMELGRAQFICVISRFSFTNYQLAFWIWGYFNSTNVLGLLTWYMGMLGLPRKLYKQPWAACSVPQRGLKQLNFDMANCLLLLLKPHKGFSEWIVCVLAVEKKCKTGKEKHAIFMSHAKLLFSFPNSMQFYLARWQMCNVSIVASS